MSVNGAATTLTAEGAKAFAGFYDAGKDNGSAKLLAAINGAKTTTKTVTETVYEGEGCDPATGKPLASTGASGVEGTLVAGFIACCSRCGYRRVHSPPQEGITAPHEDAHTVGSPVRLNHEVHR